MTTSSKPRIIGVAGTLGSGKDTVGEVLAEEYGFFHASTSDMLRAAKKKKYGDSPKALLLRADPFANELRATRGPGVLVELAYEEYMENIDKYPGGMVATAIRSIGEAEKIKELGGTMVFVDADPKIRYERTFARKRDTNDHSASYEDFLAMEKSESDVPAGDKTVQNLPAMKELADIQLENNGNDIEAFKEAAKKSLNL
jgi:dephospho-CoA kinase